MKDPEMSLRMKSVIVVGVMLILAVLIVGTYHELVSNTPPTPEGTGLPVPSVEPLNGGAYPGISSPSNSGSNFEGYPYPAPQFGKNEFKRIPVLPAPNPTNFN